MKTPLKIIIVLAVAAATVTAIALKRTNPPATCSVNLPAVGAATNQAVTAPFVTAKLPTLLDLGADKCIPCRMMFPVLDELKKEYAGRLNVEFIDVWQNPDAAKVHGVEVIPTQIFYDAEGKERFRHVGFFAKEDILAKWKELGVDLVNRSNNSR